VGVGPPNGSQSEPKYLYDGMSSAALTKAARLIRPEWVEKRGCILREEAADDDAIAEWFDATEGSSQRTESMLNHLHLCSLVEEGWDEPEGLLDERLMEVAQRIAAAWQASLRGALPNRTFDIEVVPPARAAHTGGTCGGVGAD